jgi:4-hydroxybenzoate polyprenyltransferase
MASSVYLLNDLLDLPSDRQHPTKKSRPFASGQLSLAVGLLGAPLGFILSLLLSVILLPKAFTAVLATYAITTIAYSFKLKQKLLIDVFTLAILYTLRILAGMAILGAAGYSDWLLLFSFFFFTSLAFIKRYAEIHSSAERKKATVHGRAYKSSHLQEVKIFGISSGYLSILIFALYIQSAKSIAMYQMNELLYLVCPLLMYWISRAWLITTEGRMHDDPVVFAIKDRVTYAISACIAVIVIAASIGSSL